jgi:hypothetical protein
MRDPRAFPSWLPPLVREQAHALRSEMLKSGTPDDIAVLDRMTSDPKMEAVWKYLQKHRRAGYRRTDDYEHAVRDPMAHSGVNRSSFPTRASWLQQLAMRELYIEAVRWACAYAAPASPDHLYLTDALRLRGEAQQCLEREPFGLSVATKRRLATRLRRAADAYTDAAKEARTKASEEIPRYVMMMIAGRMHDLFGKRMYGQAATIASLIMERDVTPTMVREAIVGLGLCDNGRKKRR